MEPTAPRKGLTRAGWVTGYVAVGIVVGLLVAPSFYATFHPNGSTLAPAYPIWCSDPNPQTGDTYYATYFVTNGTIAEFNGQTENGSPIPGPEQALLTIGMSSYSNQTLVHSMFCYAEEGHSGEFPFHVDLSTREVVWG